MGAGNKVHADMFEVADSIAFAPSEAGLIIAGEVINDQTGFV